MHRARRARVTKHRKPKVARARARKAAKPKAMRFRAHKGASASRVFRVHKGRRVSVFKVHGKRRINLHGAVAHKIRAAHLKKARMRKMRRASLVLSLIARR